MGFPAFAITEGTALFANLFTANAGKGDEHHPQFGELRIFANLDTFKGSVVETFTTNEG